MSNSNHHYSYITEHTDHISSHVYMVAHWHQRVNILGGVHLLLSTYWKLVHSICVIANLWK